MSQQLLFHVFYKEVGCFVHTATYARLRSLPWQSPTLLPLTRPIVSWLSFTNDVECVFKEVGTFTHAAHVRLRVFNMARIPPPKMPF